MILKCQRTTKNSKLPTKSYTYDAGWDFYAAEDHAFDGGERRLVNTGIKVAIPVGHCGIIKDRSGLAAKQGLHILAGVIDSQYRGEVKVVMLNTSLTYKYIKTGDKIAQMLILPVPIVEVLEADDLEDTDRGQDGFGSTDDV